MSEPQPPSARAISEEDKSTGYIPGDDDWTRWRNLFAALTGKMSHEGLEQFRIARDIQNEEADCKRCEDSRDYLLKYSE